MEQVFDEKTIQSLDKSLDPRFVSERQGGSNTKLKYIEGHDAIDQANRLFGYGNWAYRPLSCEQTVLLDPMTGEAVGVAYKAQVELTVRGCVAPVVDVGSQPVATWSVDEHIVKQRANTARYKKLPLDESPFTPIEKAKARGVIVEAHEQAEKGAVTDALKRALRTFGEQFGNGLYGDGRVDIDENASQGNSGRAQNGTSNHTNNRPTTPVAPSQPAKPTQQNATNLSDIPTVQKLRERARDLNIEWDTVISEAFERPISQGKITKQALIAKGDELSPESCQRIAAYLQSKQAA